MSELLPDDWVKRAGQETELRASLQRLTEEWEIEAVELRNMGEPEQAKVVLDCCLELEAKLGLNRAVAAVQPQRDTQVGTNGGLSQRWHEEAEPNSASGSLGSPGVGRCAKQLDAAKLRIEEAVKALPAYLHRGDTGPLSVSSRTAMLKIIREIL